jgi:hypothetical protein
MASVEGVPVWARRFDGAASD